MGRLEKRLHFYCVKARKISFNHENTNFFEADINKPLKKGIVWQG